MKRLSLKIVTREKNGIARSWGYKCLWMIFQKRLFVYRVFQPKRKVLGWRYPGSTVLWCPVWATAAGFFGNQWIDVQDDGLSVSGESIPLHSLLKEWCHVCHRQCVIDIDAKQKIGLSLKDTDCDTLLQFLVQTISFEKQENVFLFQKSLKGQWVQHQCYHRSPTEVLLAVKALISPMGKYEHIYADDALSFLWLPKSFYDTHKSLIVSMDQPVEQYTLHLSWLRLSEALLSAQEIDPKKALSSFQKKAFSYGEDILSFIQRNQQKGLIRVLSEMDLQLRSGETLSTKLTELYAVEKRDKKGIKCIKDVLQGLDIKIKSNIVQEGSVFLDIQLMDNQIMPGKSIQQSDIVFQNKLVLTRNESTVLGGFLRNSQHRKRECPTLLSHLPFIGRLFCHYRKEYERSKYILVVSLV